MFTFIWTAYNRQRDKYELHMCILIL